MLESKNPYNSNGLQPTSDGLHIRYIEPATEQCGEPFKGAFGQTEMPRLQGVRACPAPLGACYKLPASRSPSTPLA